MQVTQKQSGSKNTAVAQSTQSKSAQKSAPAPQAERAGSAGAASTVSIAGMDPNNVMKGLHPGFAAKVRTMLELCAKRGLKVRLFEGMRSIARQNALYNQGRYGNKGPVVTWVKGGGSYHNYGLAVDVIFQGSAPWGEKHPWTKLGQAGTDAGMYWGGNFNDRPHFEVKGISISQLQAWNRAGGMDNCWAQASKIIGGGSGGGSTQNNSGGNTNSSSGSGPGGTYTVKSGDTLSKISQRFLGRADRWREIANLNGVKDAGSLRVGQVLKLPGGSGGTKTTNPGGGTTSSSGTYTVKRGDTLSKISERLLGNSSRWREIANLNGIRDPGSLRVGQVLKLPGGTSGGTKTQSNKTYTVKRGDTLSAIAQKQLGNASRWREIANLNGIRDAGNLRIGQTLRLP